MHRSVGAEFGIFHPLGGGGGHSSQILGRYVPRQNEKSSGAWQNVVAALYCVWQNVVKPTHTPLA